MKKLLLIIVCLYSFYNTAFAQTIANAKKYKCSNGWEIKIGDTFRVGSPMNGVEFKCIKPNPFKPKTPSLPLEFVNEKIQVKEIKRYKYQLAAPKGDFYETYIVFKKGDWQYYINIEDAIKSGEVKVPFAFTNGIVANADYSNLRNDSLFTSDGNVFTINQNLTFGEGSSLDGQYLYIKPVSGNIGRFNKLSTNAPGSLLSDKSAIAESFKIIRIERRGEKSIGYRYYLMIGDNSVKYEVDIENALRFGEVVSPNRVTPEKQEGMISKADELMKLKKLYDDGVLTEAEFQAEKSKILNKD